MSSIQVVNQSEEAFLDLITDVDSTLRLYRTNVTSGLTDTQIEALTQAAFTEANFAGYAAVSMTTAWTTTQGNPSTATRAEVIFQRSSTGTAQLIYGYYVTRNSDGALRWFEHYDAPISIEFSGDTIKVTPTLTLDDAEGHRMNAGDIVGTGRTTPGPGRLSCNGAAHSRTTFALLFAAIGTAYGVGDGSTTFNVPDLRQRFPMGKAASGTGSTLGGTGGTIDHVHDLDTASSHAQISWSNNGVANDPQMRQRTGVPSWGATVAANANFGGASGVSFTDGPALAGSTDSDNPPFQTVNFEIVTGL